MKFFFKAGVTLLIILFGFQIISCKKVEVPTLITSPVNNITANSAISGGTITNDGGVPIITAGVCWSTGIEPSISDNKTSEGSQTAGYISNITSLDGGVIYYVRAYATNSEGTGYGSAMSFSTLGQAPVGTTEPASKITITSATLNGIVNANYISTTVTFEYGTSIAYGNTIIAAQNPVTGNVNSAVSSNLIGLTSGTTYHYRMKTVNTRGTIYGIDMTFITLGQLPTVTNQEVTNKTFDSATLNGLVNANYLSTSITFEYGITTSYGSNALADQSPITGIMNTNVYANIAGLSEGTIYHFRVKAVNSLGATYSNDKTFETIPSTVTDVDGNNYKVVVIGNQAWLSENLKTTKYNNGTEIKLITDNTEWSSLTTSAYCWYNNNEGTYKETYGAIYNWYAGVTNKLCPTGWHVPTNTEWMTLIFHIGTPGEAGGKLKETGTIHWLSPNTGATNQTGFTALPGGNRDYRGVFGAIFGNGIWWSTSGNINSTEIGMFIVMYSNSSSIAYNTGGDKHIGNSVRCMKDN